MPLPSIIAGPAEIYYYKKNTTSLSALTSLIGGDCSSATEEPDAGIEGARRIQGSTSYNLSAAVIGAHPDGGLAFTLLPANLSFAVGSGHNAIKVTKALPAGALGMALFVNDALAVMAPAPLAVRNGSAGSCEAVVYYEPSARATTRADVVNLMTGVTTFGFDRLNFGETTGDTNLEIQPVTATVQRNSGSDIPLVTAYNVRITANLLASGKKTMAEVMGGIASKKGGLKTNQTAEFGFRGLGVPSARPIEVVGPGETAGEEDSVILWAALRLSSEAISKAWSKENASQLPVSLVSAEDILTKGVHGTFVYTKN